MDDLILLVDIISDIIKLNGELSARFQMKDLGRLNYCLGIVVTHEDGVVKLSQRPYLQGLLTRFKMSDTNPVRTPSDPNVVLVKEDSVSQPADHHLYQRIVGSLQYAAGGTRPDMAYAVHGVAKFCHNPTQLHRSKTNTEVFERNY